MKKILSFILVLSFVFVFDSRAYAAATTINELEPNNSPSEAQLIDRNIVDPVKVINWDYTGQCVAVGNIADNTDEDWYKVYLPADANTILSINSTALSGMGLFEIYDENLNFIMGISHVQDTTITGATPYYVNIPTAGYYYVRVSTSLAGGDYRFTIGGPNYSVNSYVYKAPRACTLTTTIKSVQDTYDLRNITTIPQNAVVYKVSIGGTKTNSATNEYRSIKLQSDSSWTSTSMYTYIANIPVSSNKFLRNVWMFKLDGTVSSSYTYYSLIPQITFSYVYAVVPNNY